MDWVIGVDGGGTKTVGCAAGRDGRIIGRVELGPSNYHVIGLPAFQATMEDLLAALAEQTKLSRQDLRLFSLGLAGVDRPGDRERILAALAGLGLDCPFLVNNDARIALAAGLGGGAGIALIAGTGSIAYGVNAAGQTFRAGGWGHLISDEGSGYDIGRQALFRAIRSREGRDRPSDLLDKLLCHLDVDNMDGLIARIYNPAWSKKDLAALTECVNAAAMVGEPLAVEILAQAGDALTELVESVLSRGFAKGGPVTVCGYGSVLRHCAVTRERVGERLAGRARLLLPDAEPVTGAVRLACEQLAQADRH